MREKHITPLRRTAASLLCLMFFLAFAQAGWAQQEAKRISLEFKNELLVKAFEKIEKASQCHISFNHEDMAGYRVTTRFSNYTAEQAVKAVIGNHPLQYRVNGKFITISKKRVTQVPSSASVSGECIVTGTVVDGNGQGLPGVNVLIEELKEGASTDIYGVFKIPVKRKDATYTLTASFIGMETKMMEIRMQANSPENWNIGTIIMKEDQTALEEVVVTGIFKKAKESFTGSVSTVTAEDLEVFQGQNLLQTIRNVDASINFTVDNLAGSNPNNLPQMSIRGSSSLPTNVQEFNEGVKNSTNTPLVIMDGFEISLTKLMDYNDDEIQSINILKDASATAIYGSRGANGVIVVISKKPEAGKLRVNLEMGVNISVPDLTSYNLLNAAEKLELEKAAGLYSSNYVSQQLGLQEKYNNRLKAVLSGVDTEWLSKPLRVGVGQKYNLRLEGGSQEFRWGTSLQYNDIEGAMKGSSRRTFNGSITLMYQLKNLIFRNYTSIGVNSSKESKYGSFSDYAKQQPYNAPYDNEGNIIRYFDSFRPNGQSTQNPLYDANLNSFDKTGYTEIINNFSIEWNILKELTLRGQLGISSTHDTSDRFLPAEHSTFNTTEYEGDGFFRRGLYDYGTGQNLNYEGNITLSYNKIFNDVHQLYVGLDYSLAENIYDMYYFSAEGFSNEDMNLIINARQYAQNGAPSGYKDKSRRFSLTGNANYTYNNRYYVDLSYRMDGSSDFGSNKKYAPFWSGGVGWNIHNEPFMKKLKAISNLRLKASYGQTGSQLGAAGAAETLYAYLIDNKYLNWTGSVLQGLGNPNLTWQKTDQFSAGLEFGLWENRIKGSLDIYTKKTSNLLSNMDLPLSMGFSSYQANVGEVKNNGWEASLSAYIIRNREKQFNWMVSGQLLYNKNEITRLSEAVKKQNEEYLKQDVEVSNLFYEGHPQNAIYAVRSLGIDPSTGKEIFLDRDGNLTQTWKSSDKVFLGSSDSKYRGNLSTMLMWKGFTFNMSCGFRWGGKVYNSTLLNKVEVTTTTLTQQNVDARVLEDRWYQAGDVTFFKKLSNEVTRASSRFVMDDNTFEIQTIGLQYRWDTPALQKATHLQSLIFAINMTDILHLSSVKMERGTNYPFARSIQGSVKLMF